MTLNFTCNNKQEISRLLCLLLGQDLKRLNLQLNLDDFSKSEIDELTNELNALKIDYSQQEEIQTEENELDDNEDNEESVENIELGLRKRDMKFSIKHQWYNNEELDKKEITDSEVLFRMRRLIGEAQLLKMAKNFGVDIEIGDKAEIEGPDDKVEAIIDKILSIHYETTKPMSYNHVKILKSTLYLQRMIKEYNTKVTITYDMDAKKGFCLIFYGENYLKVSECKKKIEEVCENIQILLEVTKDDELTDKPTSILEFFKDRYKVKCQNFFKGDSYHYQIGVFYNKQTSKSVYFFFSNCDNFQFQQIVRYLDQDIKTLCFLKIASQDDYPVSFGVPLNPLRTKTYLSKIDNNSYILVGKLKHFLIELPELLQNENSPRKAKNSFQLFIQRFMKLDNKIMQELNMLAPEIETTTNFYLFTVASNPMNIIQILKKLGEILIKQNKEQEEFKGKAKSLKDNEEQIEVHFSSKEEEEDWEFQKNLIKTHETDQGKIVESPKKYIDISSNHLQKSSQIRIEDIKIENEFIRDSNSLSKSLFEDNLNQYFFTIDKNQSKKDFVLSPTDPVYQRIERLLKKDCVNAEVIELVKNIDEAEWQKYSEFRNIYGPDGVKEYLLFVSSDIDPLELVDQDLKGNEFFKSLKGSIHLKKDKFYVDEENNYNVMICIVLFNELDFSIISYYPAYFLVFA